ncbi:hypothetical protein ACH5RR_007228 [Cinchona calisaya]|uniref:Uncharacterized protein n=1 Tax=Cinchona calisaya TaxID=153742 RepID=A0ABD3AR51_9GENT
MDYDREMKVKLFIRAKLKEAAGDDQFIWCKEVGLYKILSDDKCFGECSIDRLVLFARRAAECGIMSRLDMNDIDGLLSRDESWQIDKWWTDRAIDYVECLARESRSERKRFKINGDKISEWESKGNYAFTKDDLEFGANEVENEARTHVSKVRKLTQFLPPKDLRIFGGKLTSPTLLDKFGGVPGPSTSVGGKLVSGPFFWPKNLSGMSVATGFLTLSDWVDINDYHKEQFAAYGRFDNNPYEECLAREGRSERKRLKIHGEKISDWESQGNYVFTEDDLEFGANEVEDEVRTHISKVQKLTEFTPPKDLRGAFVPIEDTIDFKVTRAKAELDALVSEKDELESKDGNDAETIRRLEELGPMILEARDNVAMLESPSSEHNLCMFGGVQPSSFVRGQNQSADDLRNFGVWEDADYRED